MPPVRAVRRVVEPRRPARGERGHLRPGLKRLRPETWTSADAAGLPILPGLVRWDEVKAGSITHAIRFTVSCTTDAYVWPARHEAGVHDPECPPMGARFRLKATFSLDGFSPRARSILRAMQRYAGNSMGSIAR